MITVKEIEEASFRRANISGYNTKDVDDFLDQVKEAFESLENENRALKAKLQEVIDQNKLMRSKVANLESQMGNNRGSGSGEEIKAILLSAQRAANQTVKEANEKSAAMLKEAQEKYTLMFDHVDDKIAAKNKELDELKYTVTTFRKELKNMYRQHLADVDAIPDYAEELLGKNIKVPAAKKAAEPVASAPVVQAPKEVPAEAAKKAVVPERAGAPATVKDEDGAVVFDFTSEYDAEELYSAMSFRKNKTEDIKLGDAYNMATDKE